MPPVSFYQATLPTWDAAAKTLTFPTPSKARAGDALLLIAATSTLIGQTSPAGWQVFGQLIDGGTGAGPNFLVLFRVVEDSEPATAIVTYAGAPVVAPLGACLLYRGLDAGQTVPVATNFATFGAATTHLIAPSAVLDTYSDLVLGLYWSAAVGASFTAISGQTERADHATGGVAGSFAVADILPGAAGASGGREATCSAAATGVAATVILKARALLAAANVARLDPILGAPGALGLPAKGV